MKGYADFVLDVLPVLVKEIVLQEDGPEAVDGISRAWLYSVSVNEITEASLHDIHALTVLHKPPQFLKVRTIPVTVGGNPALDPKLVRRALHGLLGAQKDLTPDEFYKELMEIHPWLDGNGRTGFLVWNFMRGTLWKPELPPNFWG